VKLPVIILGGGGHAKVLIEALRAAGVTMLGITDADPAQRDTSVLGIPVLGDDTVVGRHAPGSILLVNGLGSVERPTKRAAIFDAFVARGYSFAAVIHLSAVVAADVTLGQGVQIMAGAVVQTGCAVGADTIVNTRVAVDHDCNLARHVHLAPGVVLSGNVTVGEGTHVGVGATVIHGIHIGAGVLIGAGSLVTRDLPDGVTAYGLPAKVVQ